MKSGHRREKDVSQDESKKYDDVTGYADLDPINDYQFRDGVKWYSSKFNSEFGRWDAYAFEFPDGKEHFAMVKGDPKSADLPLIRLQSSCITGTAFHARLCDCRQQLHMSMEIIQGEEDGIVLYMAQEGRDHGLVEKLAQLNQIMGGLDTLDAALVRGFGPDKRDYEQGAWIIKELRGEGPVRLLSNNPKKVRGLRDLGIDVKEDLRLETEPTPGNYDYLKVKAERMGHLMPSLRKPKGDKSAAAA